MRLYLDDDSAGVLLTQFLRQAGHDVQRPIEVGLAGRDDAVHLPMRLVRTGSRVPEIIVISKTYTIS